MAALTTEAFRAKKIAGALDRKGVNYRFVMDDSSLRNERPSPFPGKGGNEIMATISVRDRDRKLLEQIELELFPVRLEKEVPPGFRISEIRLLSGLRKVIRVFLFRR